MAREEPGNFEQRFFGAESGGDYNVIWLDEDTAMVYDCVGYDGFEEYCIHFMSRTPSIEPTKFQTMFDYAGIVITIWLSLR